MDDRIIVDKALLLIVLGSICHQFKLFYAEFDVIQCKIDAHYADIDILFLLLFFHIGGISKRDWIPIKT